MHPARLFRTVRHLRPGQIVNRVIRKITPLPAAGGPAPDIRQPQAAWRHCAGRPASLLSPTRFHFIGRTAELNAAADWNSPALPKLWLYNLHYFDDLRAQDAAARTAWHSALIERWIAENPRASGNGWEPYPISLRMVNWIGWALAGNDLGAVARDSLAEQMRVLGATLEYHLLGNHLLANAKALVFAGCYFSGPEADRWLRAGLDLLASQWREQILDDGGHFELSPMYHSIILEDVLDLIQLSRIFPAQLEAPAQSGGWRQLAGRMLAWLADMSHPDGEIGFFNDAAFGIARSIGELTKYAATMDVARPDGAAPPLRHLAQSGYVRLQSGPFLVIFDMAEIGPSYLPGHGHADVLSIEVSLDGQRLITNSGTSSYADDAARHEERATAAHATVEIDRCNSSEVWSSFRVGRRARPFDASVGTAGEVISASAGHDGYRWLPGRPLHRRDVEVSPKSVIVRDRIDGTGDHTVIGRFPLHYSVGRISWESGAWRIELPGNRILRVVINGTLEHSVMDGHFAPAFGQRMLRPTLAWKHQGQLPLEVETRFEF